MIFRKSKSPPVRVETGHIPATVAVPTVEPSYLGADTAFEGNVVCDGEIHIDCELRGTVQAITCLVDTNANVQGSISAQYVVVRGRVIGPITAQQLTISKGAHVEGNVVHQGLSIEQGAFVMGTITQQMVGTVTVHHREERLEDDVPLALPAKE